MKLLGLARIGNDPEVRFTQNGDAVVNLSLAYNYGRKGDDGKKPSQWIDASLWGERAEKLIEWLTKGRQIYVELDDVHGEQYEGRNGTGFKIVGRVASLEFTAGGDQQQGQQQQRQPAQQQRQASQSNSYADQKGRAAPAQQRQPATNLADMDDDVPF